MYFYNIDCTNIKQGSHRTAAGIIKDVYKRKKTISRLL